MKHPHHTSDNFQNSRFCRQQPKRSFFRQCSNIFLKQASEMGLVRDNASSTTIIRIVVGLLLVHVIIIGGIILHGKVDMAHATTATTLTPPPTETLPVAEPKPVPGPAANPSTTHITQIPSQPEPVTPVVTTPTEPVVTDAPTIAVTDPEPTVEPVVDPVVNTTPEPVVNKPNPADIPYKTDTLKTGENLTRLARRNGVTVKEILAINPEITDANKVKGGQKIRIPLPADSQEAKDIAKARADEKMVQEGIPYKVSSGDNLGKLANRFGTSTAEIKKLNNMSNDTIFVNKIIRIPATPKARKLLIK